MKTKDEIVEAMAIAKWNAGILRPWDQQSRNLKTYEKECMSAAYDVTYAEIRDQVLEEAKQELVDNCEAQACDVIRAMKGQKP